MRVGQATNTLRAVPTSIKSRTWGRCSRPSPISPAHDSPQTVRFSRARPNARDSFVERRFTFPDFSEFTSSRAASRASLLLSLREGPCLWQRHREAGCQPPPCERHRLARHRGHLPTRPHSCRVLRSPPRQPAPATHRCFLAPALPPPASQTRPEVSAGPGAFATGNTGTGSAECLELPHPGALEVASHRRVPAGPIISPHFTDGTEARDRLVFQEGTKAGHSRQDRSQSCGAAPSSGGFHHRSRVFLPFGTLWGLYIASTLSLSARQGVQSVTGLNTWNSVGTIIRRMRGQVWFWTRDLLE